jgi:fructose-1,6-bisphosphatase/inositol monophosphatase family enzyme
VAEESGNESFAGFREAPTVFFVDPLDGNREFIEHRPEFVSMIGLLDGARAVLGVVVDPTTDVAYWGGPSLAAARLDERDVSSPVRTSETSSLAAARVVASRQRPAAVSRHLRSASGSAP